MPKVPEKSEDSEKASRVMFYFVCMSTNKQCDTQWQILNDIWHDDLFIPERNVSVFTQRWIDCLEIGCGIGLIYVSLTFVSCAIFLLIFRCRSWVYSMEMPDWKDMLDAEDEVYFPWPAGL